MTANQINYAKLKEDQRHNMRTEDLSKIGNEIAFAKAYADQRNAETNAKNAETNLLNASLRRDELLETHRANLEREQYNRGSLGLGYSQLAESTRTNQANEYLTSMRNQETERSNRQSEYLGQMQQSEMLRHNEATERQTGITTRANIVSTLINTAGNLIGRALSR
jgi:hypothetical protein